MSAILALFDFIRHIDKHLVQMCQDMGPSLYLALFAIVFAETGLVVTPFLPGDSLLFAIGVLCAMDPVRLGLPADGFVPSLPIAMAVLFVAAVLGDGVNYHIGKVIGPKVFTSEKSLLLNKKHLIKTQRFYEKRTETSSSRASCHRAHVRAVVSGRQIPYPFRAFTGAPHCGGPAGSAGYIFARYQIVKKADP